MTVIIQQALECAGYWDAQPTEDNLISCFTDYVYSGTWENLEPEDVEDLTIRQMCNALIRL